MGFGRPAVAVEVRDRFWVAVRSGMLIEAAALSVGVSEGQGRTWFRRVGGVMPPVREQLSGSVRSVRSWRLSLAEREEIACLRAGGLRPSAIAVALDRSASTISRELARHPGGRRGYRASTAQSSADKDACRPKPGKLAGNVRLREQVQDRLQLNHSPQQISCRLRVDFPDEPEMRVSHETIYQSLYVQGRGHLRKDLSGHLRSGKAVRRPRKTADSPVEGRGRIPGMINISERPACVEDRAVPGHWEGDLIVGANSGSAIGTLVERATGFTMLLHLPERHGAVAVQDAMVTAMAQLPATLRRTLTWDQGKEMSNHVKISELTGLDIYFCDPHSPWQRGSNENTNGLLRQYFPKGTDLSFHGPGILAFTAAELNNRPRRRLNWATPAEALDRLLSNPPVQEPIALTP